jgi:hypothetical protein
MYSKIGWMRFAVFIFSAVAFSQRGMAQAPMSVFNYLAAQEGSSFTLELDLQDIIDNKKTNQYFPATIVTPDGRSFNLEVRPRGKFRRKACEIPPLKLKFAKKALKANHLDTLNEVKMLVPCYNNSRGEDLILREYVAYKLYEKINPAASVRARLVKLVVRDRREGRPRKPAYALMVEHEEETAARLQGKMEALYNLPQDSFAMEHLALNAVFQYMIGNTDWELHNFRNIYLFRSFSGGKLIPLPFDFDFSGLVSAPYATPGSTTGLGKVQDRLLMAEGISAGALRNAVQTVKSKQAELLAICNASYLDKETAQALTHYLRSFFQAADTSLDLPARMKM